MQRRLPQDLVFDIDLRNKKRDHDARERTKMFLTKYVREAERRQGKFCNRQKSMENTEQDWGKTLGNIIGKYYWEKLLGRDTGIRHWEKDDRKQSEKRV